MGHATKVHEWVEDNDLWRWENYRTKDGFLHLPSYYSGYGDEWRVERVDILRELNAKYQSGRPSNRETFCEDYAPDFGEDVDPQKIGQRLFESPQVVMAASSLSLRDTHQSIPENPFDIDIEPANVPDDIPIQSRNGKGCWETELKAALLVDQLDQADVENLVTMMEREGRAVLENTYNALETTLLEAQNAGQFRNLIADDFAVILARNKEKIQNAVSEYQFKHRNREQPFKSPARWRSERQHHEQTVERNRDREENIRNEYATVSDLDSLRDRVQQLGALISEGDVDTETIQALESEISDLWDNVEATSSEIDHLRVAHNDLGKSIRQDLQELEESIETDPSDPGLADRIDTLEKQLQRLRNDTADALRNTDDALSETENQVEELEGVIDDLQSEIDDLQDDIRRADGDDVEALLEELDERRELLTQVEERVSQLESDHAALEARLGVTGIDPSDLEQLADLTEAKFDVLGRSALTRFEESIKDSASLGLYNPKTNQQVDVPESYDWDDYRAVGNRIFDSLDESVDGQTSIVNRYHEFEFTNPSGLIGRSTEIVFEAVVYGRRSWFESTDQDVPVPLTTEALVEFLEEAGGEGGYFTRAENATYPRILCVVSPTGVSGTLRELLTTDKRWSRIHPNLRLCVADLQNDELVYDDRVNGIDRNRRLFEHYTGEDYHADCVDILEELERTPHEETIRLTTLVEEHDIPPAIALQTLREFDAAGRGELYDLDSLGVEFSFDGQS